MIPSPLKAALEDLLRARRLQADDPPLRGQDRRLTPLATGVTVLDEALGGGLPRGQVSEVHGPASSGRTGLALAAIARRTTGGDLAAWIDPGDHLDPVSAAAMGADLARLLWLRGDPRAPRARAVHDAVSAAGTLLGSGLFELVAIDLAAAAADVQRLPGSTWIRLQRLVEGTPSALLILADRHVAHGPYGVSLRVSGQAPRWSGPPGPGRLLRGLRAEVRTSARAPRGVAVILDAVS
jgi:hypothetical protein